MRSPGDLIGLPVAELDTPALLLDLEALERNIAKMAVRCQQWGVGLRPHAKTHKTPEVARRQLAAGAVGVTCAKLGEAEVLADAGIDRILISTEIVGVAKVRRLLALAGRCQVLTVIDDLEAGRQLAAAATATGQTLDVLVDVNVGMGRTGVLAGDLAVALATDLSRLSGLQLVGLQGYEGNLQFLNPAVERERRVAQAMDALLDTALRIKELGIELRIISTGGTGTSRFVGQTPGVTDIQAGSYVVMDSMYAGVEGVDFEPALSVLTSVLSRATRADAVIVDAGFKALSDDHGPAIAKDGSTYEPAGDEHGRMIYAGSRPGLGDRLELIPSHCDTTINLHDVYHVIHDDQVVAIWPIVGRGQLQ